MRLGLHFGDQVWRTAQRHVSASNRQATMRTEPQSRWPFRATAGAVSACFSLSGFIWLLWPSHELKIEIGSQFGPSPRDLIGFLSMGLAAVALGSCIWSWRTESRGSATVAGAVAFPAVFVSTWLLMRMFL